MDRVPLKLPLSSTAIESCIPHRYPFLLVDTVTELDPGKMIRAVKNISLSDPILQGHFPNQPVYPGVLIVETMAQASAILAYFTKEKPAEEILLTEVSKSRFRRQVVPGDSLIVEVTLERTRGHFGWFSGTAHVGSEPAASCNFSALVR